MDERMVLHHVICSFLLIHFIDAPSQVIGPPQPLIATLGDDIILPCHLEPPMDASDIVEWARPDLSPGFIHVLRHGQEFLIEQQPSYQGRTSLFIDELKHGNASLKLSDVKLSDEGTYRCLLPKLGKSAFIKLVVGSVSSPVIKIFKLKEGVMLECRSAGWYPEPEVLWLDAEGNIVSAGPTETLRGPDGLYTVSSSVTVDNKHSNTFTCKLQHNKTNQTRETQIQVPDDFLIVKPSNALVIISIFIMSVLFVGLLSFVLFRRLMVENICQSAENNSGELQQTRERLDGQNEELREVENKLKEAQKEKLRTNGPEEENEGLKEELEKQKNKVFCDHNTVVPQIHTMIQSS